MNDNKMNVNSESHLMLSASGLDILKTKPLENSLKDVNFFDEDSGSANPNANRRINPLLSESITRMIGVPHLNDLFDEIASGLASENQQNLNALGIETYVEPGATSSPRLK